MDILDCALHHEVSMDGLDPAMRVEPLGVTLELIDLDSPQVSTPEYRLLLRLERERRVHLDLGLDREASGIGFAMLTILQLATTRQPQVDILLDDDLPLRAAF